MCERVSLGTALIAVEAEGTTPNPSLGGVA